MTSQNSFTEVTKKPSNSFDQEHLDHPISLALPPIASPSFPCHPAGPGSSIPIDAHFGGSLTEEKANYGTEKQSTKRGRRKYICFQRPSPTVDSCNVAGVTIETLPDLALLEIFDFYVHADYHFRDEELSAWLSLVHVCRKWRNVVFGSPLRLNLRLHCVARTPVTKTLDV